MNFFVPNTKDSKDAHQIYEGARRFCEHQTAWKTTNRKIFALRYRHNGNEYFAQVGEPDPTDGMIICIFECSTAFLVCTPERGVLRGFPTLVGRADMSDIQDFDE